MALQQPPSSQHPIASDSTLLDYAGFALSLLVAGSCVMAIGPDLLGTLMLLIHPLS